MFSLKTEGLLLVALFALSFGAYTLGKNPSGLKGRVVDDVEHAPIRNVYVLVHRNGSADRSTRTDQAGSYLIDLSPGIYDILVSADGFAPVCRKMEIAPEGMIVYDAVLKPSDVGMQQ
jgi:hypothetical protein